MKTLPALILHGAFVWLAVSFVPNYGALLSGLFDQVSGGLQVVQILTDV